jgi:hypothetical protein
VVITNQPRDGTAAMGPDFLRGAFDRAAGDGKALGQVFVGAPVAGVVVEVVGRRQEGFLLRSFSKLKRLRLLPLSKLSLRKETASIKLSLGCERRTEAVGLNLAQSA